MAESLVASLTAAFEPAKYRDEYREQVLDLIEIKASGEAFELPEAEVEKPKVVDLMAALEASVAKAKEARGRHPSGAKKPASKRKAAATKTTAKKTTAKKSAAKKSAAKKSA